MYLEKIDDRKINEISKSDLIDDIELNNDILIRKVISILIRKVVN